ncbi:MAG TPA: ComEC/Rec2 family competence protein, partial [Longimicrobiaceae bacterium]|nr:ComEC/Rec2 family competence protein [Longimicrobiaceae bacterium]
MEAILGFPTIITLGREEGDPALRWLFIWRERLADAIERALPEPHAALSSGILLGRRTTLPRDLVEQLSRSGTSHIVAVSGFNVSVVVAFAIALLGHSWPVHPRRRAFTALLASLMLWGFVALVGSSGSVLRAAAMSQLALIGRATGRTGTAGAMLLWGSAFLASWD